MKFSFAIDNIEEFNHFLTLNSSNFVDLLVVENSISFIFKNAEMFLLMTYPIMTRYGIIESKSIRIEKEMINAILFEGVLEFELDDNLSISLLKRNSSGLSKDFSVNSSIQVTVLEDIDKYMNIIKSAEDYKSFDFRELASIYRVAVLGAKYVLVDGNVASCDLPHMNVFRPLSKNVGSFTLSVTGMSYMYRFNSDEFARFYNTKDCICVISQNKYMLVNKLRFDPQTEYAILKKKGSSHILKFTVNSLITILRKIKQSDLEKYTLFFEFDFKRLRLKRKDLEINIQINDLNVVSNADQDLDFSTMLEDKNTTLFLGDASISSHNIPEVSIPLSSFSKIMTKIFNKEEILTLRIKKSFLQVEYNKFIIIFKRMR